MQTKKKILNNPGLMLLSFILAVLLWLVVANIENPVTTKQFRDVPVVVKNEAVLDSINKVYEIKSGSTAEFTVKGRRSVIDGLRESDFNVIADLSHMSEVCAIPVEITAKNVGSAVEISKNNNTMVVSLEDESTESFPINVETTGEVNKGYAIGEKSAKPNIVEVTGPKSLVRKIDKVAVMVDVTHTTTNINKKCDLVYYNSDGDELDGDRLVASVNKIETNIQILKTKEISVEVNAKGNPAKGYSLEELNYEPQTITIAGTDDVLSQVSTIVINDVDITGLKEDKEYSFAAAEYLPDGVILKDPEQKIMVTVKIGQITTKVIEIKASQIDIAAGSAKYQYVIDPDTKIRVALTGYKDVISNISASDLHPMIDVSSLGEGSHLCTLVLSDLERVNVSVSGKVPVKIKIDNGNYQN